MGSRTYWRCPAAAWQSPRWSQRIFCRTIGHADPRLHLANTPGSDFGCHTGLACTAGQALHARRRQPLDGASCCEMTVTCFYCCQPPSLRSPFSTSQEAPTSYLCKVDAKYKFSTDGVSANAPVWLKYLAGVYRQTRRPRFRGRQFRGAVCRLVSGEYFDPSQRNHHLYRSF